MDTPLMSTTFIPPTVVAAGKQRHSPNEQHIAGRRDRPEVVAIWSSPPEVVASAAGKQAQRYCYARAEGRGHRRGAARDRPEVVAICSWQPAAIWQPSQLRSQPSSQPPHPKPSTPSQPSSHPRSQKKPPPVTPVATAATSCRQPRAPSTPGPPVMLVASFGSRSESFGSPQPLAEESIARTSTLNIVLSCQGGSFASMHSTGAGGGSRRQEAGWGRVG